MFASVRYGFMLQLDRKSLQLCDRTMPSIDAVSRVTLVFTEAFRTSSVVVQSSKPSFCHHVTCQQLVV